MDSGPLRAIYNPKDEYHQKTLKINADLKELGCKFVTTDYVVDEVYTGLITKTTYTNTMEFDSLIRKGDMKIEKITANRFAMAQEVFRKYNKDKIWSFTNCTSYVVMKEWKIKTVFTFDKNFEEMGFKLL